MVCIHQHYSLEEEGGCAVEPIYLHLHPPGPLRQAVGRLGDDVGRNVGQADEQRVIVVEEAEVGVGRALGIGGPRVIGASVDGPPKVLSSKRVRPTYRQIILGKTM